MPKPHTRFSLFRRADIRVRSKPRTGRSIGRISDERGHGGCRGQTCSSAVGNGNIWRQLINIASVILSSLGLLTNFVPSIAAAPPAQSFGPTKRFKIAEPYPPPYETQTKSLLEGGKALPMPGGKY